MSEVKVVVFGNKKMLDELNMRAIVEDLVHQIDDQKFTRLLLNFTGVEFMSSEVLSMLVRLHQRMIKHSGKMILSDISPNIREILALTKLDKFFHIVKDEQAGLDSFK